MVMPARILIVDDEPANRHVCRLYLEGEGRRERWDDLIYTLNVGRSDFEHRLALVVVLGGGQFALQLQHLLLAVVAAGQLAAALDHFR